jgi:hypothetical protein
MANEDAGVTQDEAWVIEDDPPPERPRWYCEGKSFDTPEDAVARALTRGRSVLVRTVGGRIFWARELPATWDNERDGEARPWPPTPSERQQIDDEYAAKLRQAEEDEQAREEYEYARLAWLIDNHPDAPSEPVREYYVEIPDSDECFVLEQLTDGGLYGACRVRSRVQAFGDLNVVAAAVTDRTLDDAWVTALCAAVERGLGWVGMTPRWQLEVNLGDGEMFHVTAATNRESIRRHGLDWRLMVERGIAGNHTPELDGVFLCETLEECRFFITMARVPVDIWAVAVEGCWVENGPDGWVVLPEPVPPERLRLVGHDIEP